MSAPRLFAAWTSAVAQPAQNFEGSKNWSGPNFFILG